MPWFVVWVVRNASAAKPSSTNAPAPTFNVLDLPITMTSLQERGRQQVIQEQHDDRRGDHCARGRESHTLGGRLGVIALINGDETAGEAEDGALDQPLVDVAKLNRGLHLRPEAARVDTHDLYADELRPVQADEAENRREQGHCDDAAQKPRHDHARSEEHT